MDKLTTSNTNAEAPTPINNLYARIYKRIKLMSYQYSVTFPFYGLEPLERFILHICLPLSALIVLYAAFWVFKMVFFALLIVVGHAQSSTSTDLGMGVPW
ncbi:uncharacterized protein LY89DRAFT_689993 [Mollisia scopiformis]|uniref:Uncharacterized protein n=1 Tax=Mollisia scopiformis TaxID=149040 RepID=A0A132BCM4_MOLSC|nr:uncharacterized protein LY89DRAFT_689993 [Mollisia scopiformis]KUJ10182.1 hypothetical protein LY89DRAFT_689993 [Mollisia scopiformis]